MFSTNKINMISVTFVLRFSNATKEGIFSHSFGIFSIFSDLLLREVFSSSSFDASDFRNTKEAKKLYLLPWS